MMLRFKTGRLNYEVTDLASDSTWVVYPKDFLTSKQTSAMAGKPDMIWQFAQHLKKEYAIQGKKVSIKAHAKARLNLGEEYTLIDPQIDLAATNWNRFQHSDWILSPN